ncbi:MAG: MOSC domain-containing protein [Boseongicola sp.]|nr:MOSC domain-containing protein [Boseongicola sp.]MDD9977526.1 MOSC domain-containing protein [Boseongicola sp.]
MPALIPTEHYGAITWIGHVADREAALASAPLDAIDITFAGLATESHGGLTRPSCSRVTSQYARGTEIRNTRQFSIVSTEELAAIAAEMGVGELHPSWIGASIAIKGLPDFSHIPPSSRLQGESGATLTIDMQNRPCHLPAKVIDEMHPGAGKLFKAAAAGRRGVTAWVEREGTLRLGERVRLHVPDQRAWMHSA